MDSDPTPQEAFPEGQKFILFLKNCPARESAHEVGKPAEPILYEAFDPWFSCQPYHASMEVELERLMRDRTK